MSRAQHSACSGSVLNLMRLLDMETWDPEHGQRNHAVVLGRLPLATVWRLRGVSRTMRRWCDLVLRAMPRPVILGGDVHSRPRTGGDVDSLDLTTMSWTSNPANGDCGVSGMPWYREGMASCQHADGRIVVVGGCP